MIEFLIIVFVLSIVHRIRAGNREAQEKREEEKAKRQREEAEENRRQSTPCLFLDGLSRSDFEDIVYNNANRVKRIKRVTVNGPHVHGRVVTNSGISEWDFHIDFNDYGRITGKYWLSADNYDSTIPTGLAESIADDIKWYYKHPPIRNTDDNVERDPNTEKKRQNSYQSATQENDDSSEVNKDSYDEQEWEDTEINEEEPMINRRNIAMGNEDGNSTFTVIAVLVTLLILAAAAIILSLPRKIPVGFQQLDFKGKTYREAVYTIRESGFENITLEAMDDLTAENTDKENYVDAVVVDGKINFVKGDKFPEDAKITVFYHSVSLVRAPITSKQAKGNDVEQIKKQFEKAGFVDITCEPNYDVTLGVFHKAGDVISIWIDGDNKFSEEDDLRPDAEVVIKYHASKKEKP